LKQLFRSGTTISGEEEKPFCSKNEKAAPSRFGKQREDVFLRMKRCRRRFIYWKEKLYQLNELTFLLIYLIAEFFVLGEKPECPKNFSTGRERSSLKDIGTIFIALPLHWSNGYCTSLSSSDDG
jgi:hypothetical protein